MKSVFILQHSYEYGDENEHDETKMIGVYSTKEKAREAIEKLRHVDGFCDYPVDCFYMSEYELNKDHWIEGFAKVCY